MRDQPDWTALTKEQRLNLMEPHRLNGESAAEIAAHFQNCSRNAALGALHRAHRSLQAHIGVNAVKAARSKSSSGGKKYERSTVKVKTNSPLAVKLGGAPPQPVYLDPEDGVDCTSLIGFADRRIGHECAWISGDPLNASSGFCGRPTVDGSQWCEVHHRRVYNRVSG